MMRCLAASLVVALCFSIPAKGAPPAAGVAKKPNLAWPQTELGDANLQDRYGPSVTVLSVKKGDCRQTPSAPSTEVGWLFPARRALRYPRGLVAPTPETP